MLRGVLGHMGTSTALPSQPQNGSSSTTSQSRSSTTSSKTLRPLRVRRRVRARGRTHEDLCYKENEIVITFANHYGLETKTDEHPAMPLTPRRKSLEMGAFEYQECAKDRTVPKSILMGKGPSHQDGSFRRSSPASCVKSSPRLASAMSAPGDSAGVVFRPAEGATRRAVSSVPLTTMKGALGGDAGR